MAELVSAFLPVLLEKLMSPELQRLNFAAEESVRSKLQTWEITLKTIDALLVDAEEKQLTNEAVKMWVEDVQDLTYDAEDILDEYATEALRRKLKIEEHQASTSRAPMLILEDRSVLWSDFSMHSKRDDITRRLEDLWKKGTELGLVEIAGGRPTASWQRPPTTNLQIEPAVCGRLEDKAKILKMALTDEPGDVNFRVISIVGTGGLGKTTLAREIYNDEAMKDFNPKGWVCVSKDFDVTRISTAILESITGSACKSKNLNAVQNQLKVEIAGRKFLLVLDDVWSEDYSKWKVLRSPFMVGAHGSKIIVTTRHESVALTMGHSNECHTLIRLSDDDCWSLFSKHAFDNEVMGAHYGESIRRSVIEKCNGLPLAARTLGGLLHSMKKNEWLDILHGKTWELLDRSEIPIALQISYYHLPFHLKRCFAYCGILPKNYEFEEEELVFLWMAEGLIQQSSDNKQLEELGGEYFRDLLSRSIFQISSHNSSKFIMHDLLNDFAQIVLGKLGFRLEAELESNNQSRIYEKTRYASHICHEFDGKRKFEVFNDAKHLRAHLTISATNDRVETNYISNRVISNLLSRFKKLRALSLQKYCIVELPEIIGGLIHLRYLNLAYSLIRSLPQSINSMCNLQTLILRNCCKLLEWPGSMENLINLRHFDILGATSIQEMPEGIRKWKCLRTLSNFIVGKHSKSDLKDLKDLKLLCGELHISKLEDVTTPQDIGNVILSDKKDLKVLLLEWGSSFDESRDEEVDKKVLDILQPYEKLEKLTIKCYGGIKFSTWVGDSSFSNMTVLELKDCEKCTSLPSLGQLGSLNSLTIKGMKGIKSIGSEFYGEHCLNPFQSLITLCFEDLEECECWAPIKEHESFHKLQLLSIVNCPKLSERLPNNLSSLKKLVIRKCEQLVVSLSNIPMICELELSNIKMIVCSTSVFSESLVSMTLSNISNFGDWSKQELKKVQNLKIEGCKEVIKLWQNEIFLNERPQGLHSLISLKKVEFINCNSLTTLLEGIKQKNAHVEELRVESCDSLSSIFRGQLSQSLKKLCIENCKELQLLLADNQNTHTSLSSATFSLYNTFHLERLEIKTCPSLTSLPLIPQLSTTLTSLIIFHCSKLLTCHLPGALKHLEIWYCSNLTTLSPTSHLPESLETLTICHCPQIKSIVEKFQNNKALFKIFISSCHNLKSLPKGLETLGRLHSIFMRSCQSFTFLPNEGFPYCNLSIGQQGVFNENLRVWIKGCKNLLSQLSYGNLRVHLHDCPKLEALPKGLHYLSSLEIFNCPILSLVGDSVPIKLAWLSIEGFKQYKAVMDWGLHNLTSLTDLHISGGLDGESFQEEDFTITLPRSLTKLRIEGFPKLKNLPFKNFEDLPFLEYLLIEGCLELTSLPILPSLLLQLYIKRCPLLKEASKKDRGKEWSKIAEIPCVKINDKFIYDPEE